MRWQNREESGRVEDRRGRSPGFRGRGRPVGLLTILVVLAAGYYGVDLSPLLTGGDSGGPAYTQPYQGPPREQEMARFSSVILKTTEDAWGRIFRQSGQAYAPPRLVLYAGATPTTCGYGESAMGPFYCPGDQTVYLDLSFYQDMKDKLGGGGDFAQGYVIAHEVGHHVQHLLGIDRNVRRQQKGAPPAEANRLSVRMELQADCLAGVWGQAMAREGLLEAGDLETALRTAQAIGDDRLQQQSAGRVVPDSFTHGTSAQRLRWFRRGFDSGDPNLCDTFSTDD